MSEKKPINLLIIEDSEDDADLLVSSLRRAGFAPKYERVHDGRGLENALVSNDWDLVISDHSMPGFSATAAIEMILARNLDLPLIIVSGTIESNTAVAAMKAGASDFVMKDDLTRLIPAIERELREAANRRARRKAEEERESFRAQLLQAQKMEAMGKLAGGVAHDFNNVLTAMSGYCHFLLDGMSPDDPKREDVLEIMKAGKRAANLTRQLLAFSRRQVVEWKVIDLNVVVKDVQKMFLHLIGEDVELETRLQPEIGRIRSDTMQLEQILINLGVNARDAMPKGGKLIIETSNVDIGETMSQSHLDIQPGPHVLLAVTDSGTGMDAETRERIFEPFFTTKGRGRGTGLGLAVVYGIVKQHGGGILVHSEPGRGTTFKIYFPRVNEAPTPAPVEAPTRAWHGTETILLVEDDEAVRKFAHRVLVQNGYKVLPALTPDEALRISREYNGTIQLLVSDVVMPGMRGDELAQRIRSTRTDIRLLFTSGYSELGLAGREILAPGRLLEKPLAPGTLLAKVREALDLPNEG